MVPNLNFNINKQKIKFFRVKDCILHIQLIVLYLLNIKKLDYKFFLFLSAKYVNKVFINDNLLLNLIINT